MPVSSTIDKRLVSPLSPSRDADTLFFLHPCPPATCRGEADAEQGIGRLLEM